MGAFISEKIQFQVVGMSAAVLQGVPVATLDVDIWLNMPLRQYMRAVNLALKDGAAQDAELRKSHKLNFHGLVVPVMPLESIRKSKAAIMRPKDSAHIHYIDETLRARKANRRRK